MKTAVAIVGAIILVAGIVGTVLVTQAQSTAMTQMTNECFANPATPACFNLAGQVAMYGLYFWLTIFVALIGVIILILGLVLGAVTETPATMGAPPQPYPYPATTVPPVAGTQTAPCIRCGQPARWVPGYNRWYCDAERMYV